MTRYPLFILAAASLLWSAPPPPLAPAISKDALRAHLAFLSDDLLEGRGMGQRGGDLAVAYLEAQLRALGLKPANGTRFRQDVRLVGMTPRLDASRISFHAGATPLDLPLGRDVFIAPTGPRKASALDAPLVFVGHGVEGGHSHRHDFEGLDTRGKVLVMLMGERPDTSALESCCTPEHYFSRWTYKFEEGARRGAAAVLIVHTSASAGYDWRVATTGWTTERFALESNPENPTLGGLVSEEGARRLFAAAGLDFVEMVKRAETRDFRPVDMGIRAQGTVETSVRRLVQHNVAALLPGTDPVLAQECVIYSAHWDHFGRRSDGRIYNGAVDNASGCAGALAIAQAAVQKPAPRSQLFLLLTGEETGLLGALAYVREPLVPLDRTVAVLNLESLNFLGRTRDIAALGAERSELGELARQTATALGMRFRPSGRDLPGLYFRADHFAFVRGGVPAISPGFSLNGGWDYIDAPAASQARAEAWLRDGYHQPTDRYDPSWKLDGMEQQVQFIFELGQRIAARPRKPAWVKGRPDFGRP